jgi:hypothetical protein
VVRFNTKSSRSGEIANAIKQLIGMIHNNPYLFEAVADFVISVQEYSDRFEEIIGTACKPIPSCSSNEVKSLAKYLTRIYKTDQPDWGIDMRRGYIVEELIASLKPKKLGLLTIKSGHIKRESCCFIEDELVSPKKIDVVVEGNNMADGIECKVNLSTWLSSTDAESKLSYMQNLIDLLSPYSYVFCPWLGTFKTNEIKWQEFLLGKGFDRIKVISRENLEKALNLAC